MAYYTLNFSLFFNLGYDISQLLATVGNLSACVAVVFTYNALWFRQQDILKFLSESRVNRSIGKIRTVVIVLTISIYTLQLGFTVLPDTPLYLALEETTLWIRKLVMQNTSNSLTQQILLIGTKILEIFLIQGGALFIMPILLLVFLFLQLKCLGQQFEKLIEGSDFTVKEAILKYDKLRKTVECVNGWNGGNLLWMYVCTLALLANLPGYLRDEQTSAVGKIHPLVLSVLIGVAMVIGSDLPKRVTLTTYYI